MPSIRTLTVLPLLLTSAFVGGANVVACSDDDPSRAGGLDASTADSSAPALPDATPPEGRDAAEPGSLRISFAALVGTMPFRCGDSYAAVGSPPREMTPVDFRMYVHDVRVVTPGGTEVPLTLRPSAWQLDGVALLDFEDATHACTDGDAPTNSEIIAAVPPGLTAGGLKFRLGVPFELNHRDVSSQPPPLDKTSLFWAWKSGHIFFAAVGRTRVPLDGGVATAPYDHYTHLGSLGCTGDPATGSDVTCAKPNRPEVVLPAFDPAIDEVVVDFAAVKAGSDLTGDTCHGGKEACVTPCARLGIDWTTGSYLPSQDVFRARKR